VAKPSVKDKIMEAALDRFHALGFNACGVQEIVDVAGVPKGSFYNYFKAKEGLAVEVLALYAQGSRIEMLADRTKPPVQRLRDHFEFFVSRYAEGDFARGCLLGNLGSEVGDTMPPIREAAGRFPGHGLRVPAAPIEAGAGRGLLTEGRPCAMGR